MSGENIVVIPEGWISGQEAANLTGYTIRYLRKLAREKRLRATKLGRDWLFERESLLKWKEQMNELGTKKHSPKTKKTDQT
jgi:excisionase family DNA binding protein